MAVLPRGRFQGDGRRWEQQPGQCRGQDQRAEHVPDKHEGQQDPHVRLELDW